jgi:hypothetical protein
MPPFAEFPATTILSLLGSKASVARLCNAGLVEDAQLQAARNIAGVEVLLWCLKITPLARGGSDIDIDIVAGERRGSIVHSIEVADRGGFRARAHRQGQNYCNTHYALHGEPPCWGGNDRQSSLFRATDDIYVMNGP